MKEYIAPERHTGGWGDSPHGVYVAVGDAPNPDLQALSFAQEVVTDPRLRWLGEAVCPQTDAEAFFPEIGINPKEAKKICQSCESLEPCLEGALERREEFGIWGATTRNERRAILKQRKQAENQ